MAEGCGHEWDEFYSIKADPPTVCPSCKEEGQVKRLISGGSGKGIVILTGYEQRAAIQRQGKQLARDMAVNENIRANFVGEDVYHQQQLNGSKLENQLLNIGKEAPKEKKSEAPKKGLVKRVDKT